MKINKFFSFDKLWDLWCILSIIGIWPRFIEPNWLQINRLSLKIPSLPPQLDKLKVLQISDIHLNKKISSYFLKKIRRKLIDLQPDIIVYTGDFLCYSTFADKKRLEDFFKSLPKARYGNYAILGNHDYQEYAYVNDKGDYDVGPSDPEQSIIANAFKRLSSTIVPTAQFTDRVKNTPLNEELLDMLKKTDFQLLHNETIQIPINGTKLNLCGLGEYMLGRLKPDEAFRTYDSSYPGIILAHNPDSVPHLRKYPGDIILCGHTHGGQINLPWVWKKFMLVENMQFKSGLKKEGQRWIYINKGLGGVLNFRWFCPPEIFLMELRCKNEDTTSC